MADISKGHAAIQTALLGSCISLSLAETYRTLDLEGLNFVHQYMLVAGWLENKMVEKQVLVDKLNIASMFLVAKLAGEYCQQAWGEYSCPLLSAADEIPSECFLHLRTS